MECCLVTFNMHVVVIWRLGIKLATICLSLIPELSAQNYQWRTCIHWVALAFRYTLLLYS